MDDNARRKYQLNRYYARKQYWINALGGRCKVCGSTENLEFDHIDPSTKSFTLTHKIVSTPPEIILGELSKCQLLCELHHLEKTIAEASIGHGDGLTGKRNCRCNLCGPLKAKYQEKYKSSSPKDPKEIQHGTRSGYLKEGRLGVERCDSCRAANTEYSKQLKSRLRGQIG